MREADWNNTGDSVALLRHVGERATDRQVRLVACACARSIEELFAAQASSSAIAAAENFADGLISEDELAEAEQSAREASAAATRDAHAVWNHGPAAATARKAWIRVWARCAAQYTCDRHVYSIGPGSQETNFERNIAIRTAQVASWAASVMNELEEPDESLPDSETAVFFGFLRGLKETVQKIARAVESGSDTCESVRQARIVRDIIGNPFQPVALAHEWRFAHDWNAYRIAQGIYNDRTFTDLPILGDALEDAGCNAQTILRHLREVTLHVRGCWVLDLVLDKERLSREAAERNTLKPEKEDAITEGVFDQSA